jgi:hypothetical protein
MKCPSCEKLYTEEDIAKDEGNILPFDETVSHTHVRVAGPDFYMTIRTEEYYPYHRDTMGGACDVMNRDEVRELIKTLKKALAYGVGEAGRICTK